VKGLAVGLAAHDFQEPSQDTARRRTALSRATELAERYEGLEDEELSDDDYLRVNESLRAEARRLYAHFGTNEIEEILEDLLDDRFDEDDLGDC